MNPKLAPFLAAGLDPAQAAVAFARGYTVEVALRRFGVTTGAPSPASASLPEGAAMSDRVTERARQGIGNGAQFGTLDPVPIMPEVASLASRPAVPSAPAQLPVTAAAVASPEDIAYCRSVGIPVSELLRKRAAYGDSGPLPSPLPPAGATPEDIAYSKSTGTPVAELLRKRADEAKRNAERR